MNNLLNECKILVVLLGKAKKNEIGTVSVLSEIMYDLTFIHVLNVSYVN